MGEGGSCRLTSPKSAKLLPRFAAAMAWHDWRCSARPRADRTLIRRGADYDFLVEFEQRSDLSPLDQFFGFAEALKRLLGRPVDLLERKALEASRNYIRRRAILRDAETIMAELPERDAALLLDMLLAARDAQSFIEGLARMRRFGRWKSSARRRARCRPRRRLLIRRSHGARLRACATV